MNATTWAATLALPVSARATLLPAPAMRPLDRVRRDALV